MLIPIGFFGGGAAGSFEHISTAYGNGSSSIISFNSIPNNYKHLQIRYTGKAAYGGNQFFMTYNNQAVSAYAWHSLFGNGSSVGSNNSSNDSYVNLQWGMAGNNATPITVVGIIDILDYTSAKNVTTKITYGTQGDPNAGNRIVLGSGMIDGAFALNTITMTFGGAVQTLSRFSLYGIKGA